MNNEKLMQDLYYNPNTQLTSIRNLYNAVKQNGVKYDEVKQFIQSQESNQLFKKHKRIKKTISPSLHCIGLTSYK